MKARADGCLGGPTGLDQAVLTAQRQAPLTETGAAAFAATVLRWATATPAPPSQDVTAEQILAEDATTAARNLSGTKDPQGYTGSVSFSDGEYYVEVFDGTSAIVSVIGRVTGTRNGAPLGEAFVYPAIRLTAQNGSWRFQDISEERTLANLQRIGTPYAGGC